MPKGVYTHHPHQGFQKGHISPNKGKHIYYGGGNKKGCIPWNKDKKLPQIKGKNNPNWKNGKFSHQDGYILIYKPNHPLINGNYIFEHRLVVESQIGRYLTPEEKCHHLNEIKTDNRSENLMAFANESAHQRFHFNPNNVKSKAIIFDGRQLHKV